MQMTKQKEPEKKSSSYIENTKYIEQRKMKVKTTNGTDKVTYETQTYQIKTRFVNRDSKSQKFLDRYVLDSKRPHMSDLTTIHSTIFNHCRWRK